jgi:tetratricopeptide (TPR) repeat protein
MMGSRWRWWGADGKPAEGVEEAVRVIEGVLRRNPEHPGANHYYIHAVEMSPTPERAVPSAQRLMGIVPGAGHLVHMPGHIWMLLGEYDAAAAANERAAEVDRQYMKATGVTMSAYAGYYIHNLHFVAVGRSMQGRALDSLKAAEALSDATTPYVKDMAAMIDAFVMWPAFAALRAGQWEKALAIPKPDERLLASAAIWHYARALAFHGQGRKAEAEKAREAFEAARAKVPSSWVWLLNKAPDILAVASAVLEARLAGDEASIEHWRRAVRLQDGLAYDEPPGWYYPIRESLGGALLRAGRSAEAEQVFRKGVRLSPKNGRMLFGLMESLKAQRKAGAAKMVEREFDAAWKRADVKLLVGDL